MSEFGDYIDVFDMLVRLGLEHVHEASGGAELCASCPFHRDERPSFYMNATSGAWTCFSCHEKGRTPVSLVAKVEGVGFAVAERWLREAYGVDFREPQGGSMRAEVEARLAPVEVPELRQPSPSWQQAFREGLWRSPGLDYALRRGLTKETIDEWGLGYDEMSHRLTIPVHDLEGELIGFKGRDIIGQSHSKYLVLGDRRYSHYGFDPYETSQVVFGLDRVHDVEEICLVEGELNAIALWQAGVARPAALGMSHISDMHVELLVREASKAILFFDDDDAGRPCTRSSTERLESRLIVCQVGLHEGDPMSMSPEESLRLIQEARNSVATSLSF